MSEKGQCPTLSDIEIRPTRPDEFRKTEELVREAFWNVYRPGCTEHFVPHCLRKDPAFVPDLDLVLTLDGLLAAQIVFVRSCIDCGKGAVIPVMTFGPVCVAPAYRKRGLGTLLLLEAMNRAKGLGVGALCITGDIAFYQRLGFTYASDFSIRYRDADSNDPVVPYFLAKELQPGFLTGVRGTYVDPVVYFAAQRFEKDFKRFEATFPAKDTKVLPGQLFS